MEPKWSPNGAKKVSSGVRFGHFFEDSWGPKSCKYAIQVTKNEGPHFGCKIWLDFCAMFFEFDHCFFMFLNAQILEFVRKFFVFYYNKKNNSKNTVKNKTLCERGQMMILGGPKGAQKLQKMCSKRAQNELKNMVQ